MLRKQYSGKALSNLETNVNYIAYMSECMIEVCNTHRITFDYVIMKHIFSHILPSSLHLAWNVFDCLLQLIGPRVMMVNIGARIATVNIVFSTWRNAALIESKMLQYTTISN